MGYQQWAICTFTFRSLSRRFYPKLASQRIIKENHLYTFPWNTAKFKKAHETRRFPGFLHSLHSSEMRCFPSRTIPPAGWNGATSNKSPAGRPWAHLVGRGGKLADACQREMEDLACCGPCLFSVWLKRYVLSSACRHRFNPRSPKRCASEGGALDPRTGRRSIPGLIMPACAGVILFFQHGRLTLRSARWPLYVRTASRSQGETSAFTS